MRRCWRIANAEFLFGPWRRLFLRLPPRSHVENTASSCRGALWLARYAAMSRSRAVCGSRAARSDPAVLVVAAVVGAGVVVVPRFAACRALRG